MAKRLTDTDIWDKEWFMKLSPKLKCLVKFVRDKCDLSGVWNPNWTLAQVYIGEKVNEKELLEIDNGDQFHKLKSGKIFCVDFIQFQNGTLSDKSPIHVKILSLLKIHDIPYPYPINRVFNTPVVGVIVKEDVKVGEEPVVDKTKKLEIYDPYPFELFWGSYDKKVGKPKAEKKWMALSDKEREDILSYIPKYKKVQPEKKYRKNPETFLNNRSWEDELIGENKSVKDEENKVYTIEQ